MTGWTLIGLMMAGLLALFADTGPDDGEGDDDPDTDTEGPAIEDGMSADDVQDLLRKERDRLDMKLKDAVKTAREQAAEDAKTELEAEREREEMEELEREKADREAAQEARDALASELEATQARSARLEFIAANAGDLDRAHRLLLDYELQEADEDKDWETVLEGVREEFEASRNEGARDVGGPSRPAEGGNEPSEPPEGDLTPYQQQMRRYEEAAD